jgi:hypothetical protein
MISELIMNYEQETFFFSLFLDLYFILFRIYSLWVCHLLLQKCLKKVSLQKNEISFTDNKRIIKFDYSNYSSDYQSLYFINL